MCVGDRGLIPGRFFFNSLAAVEQIMRAVHLIFIFTIAMLLIVAPLLPTHLQAEESKEEEESIAEIVERSDMAPALQETVIELFDHIHLLETSFRNGLWKEASHEVDQIDLFYSKILKISEELKSRVELAYLQAFEFSLAEITRGINRRDRELVENRFLELQPELFDILDRFTVIPLRLTASRFYIDLAINALEENRFDIALAELDEISEYIEQLEEPFAARALDMAALNKQLSNAHQILEKHGAESRQVLQEIRQALDQSYQAFSSD